MQIELNKIPSTGLQIDSIIKLDKTFYQNTSILDLKDLYLKGIIDFDYENNLNLNLEVKGIFILSDAITLEPIEYPFSSLIDEKLTEIDPNYSNFYDKSKNTLDISEILWENIVLEVPISATKTTTDNLNLKGEGWELVKENVTKIDPRLAKLSELFKDGKE